MPNTNRKMVKVGYVCTKNSNVPHIYYCFPDVSTYLLTGGKHFYSPQLFGCATQLCLLHCDELGCAEKLERLERDIRVTTMVSKTICRIQRVGTSMGLIARDMYVKVGDQYGTMEALKHFIGDWSKERRIQWCQMFEVCRRDLGQGWLGSWNCQFWETCFGEFSNSSCPQVMVLIYLVIIQHHSKQTLTLNKHCF